MYAGFGIVCIYDFLSFTLSLRVPTHSVDLLNGVYRLPSLPESPIGSNAARSAFWAQFYIQVP